MKRLAVVLLALLMSAVGVFPQGALIPDIIPVYPSATGAFVPLGFLCSFAAGTTTPLSTYSDSVLTSANHNPIQLNAAGRPIVWAGSNEISIYVSAAAYKFNLYAPGTSGSCNGSPVGALIRSVDNVSPGALFFLGSNLDNVRLCDKFPGANAGMKMAACAAALPSTGGTADARGFEGNQSIAQDVIGSTGSKPVKWLIGQARFDITVSQTCPGEPVIIQGSHTGSGDATPSGSVFAGNASLGANPVLRCADLGSRWSQMNDMFITTAASTSGLIVSNLGMNMTNVFVTSSTAAACEMRNMVGATLINVHCVGSTRGFWINPVSGGDDVALNTFIAVTGGANTVAGSTGIRIDGYTSSPMNHFIGCNVEGADYGIYSDGSQTGFDDCETEVNVTYGLYDTDRAQSLFLRRKTNDTLRMGSTSSDILPRTQQTNSFYQNTQFLNLLFATTFMAVNSGSVPAVPLEVKAATGARAISVIDSIGTWPVVKSYASLDGGVRYGVVGLYSSTDGSLRTYISADAADPSVFGGQVRMTPGSATAPSVVTNGFTNTGPFWAAGPLMGVAVGGDTKAVFLNATTSATTSSFAVNFGGTFSVFEVGASNSCGTGYKCLRIPN